MKFITLFENFINEYRNKDVYSIVRPLFKNTPEYVFKELYYSHNGFFKSEFIKMVNYESDIEDIETVFSDFINIKWKKQIIEVNFDDFDDDTQDWMIERKMGELIVDVPNDEVRTIRQRDIAVQNYGKNEPVIIVKKPGGYHLYEGWHRAMAILSLGSDGTEKYENWNKVKINAWIGS
jgi:hypothetical protein